jgi:hypothetical protein
MLQTSSTSSLKWSFQVESSKTIELWETVENISRITNSEY